jgi:hypothetical protein
MEAIRHKGAEASEEEKLELAAHNEAVKKHTAADKARYARKRDEMEAIRHKGAEASEEEKLELAAYDQSRAKKNAGKKRLQEKNKSARCSVKDAKEFRKKIALGTATDKEKELVHQRDAHDQTVKESNLRKKGCTAEQAKEIKRKMEAGTATDEEKQAYQKRLDYLAYAKRRNDKQGTVELMAKLGGGESPARCSPTISPAFLPNTNTVCFFSSYHRFLPHTACRINDIRLHRLFLCSSWTDQQREQWQAAAASGSVQR